MTARSFINYKNIAGNFSRFGHKLYAKQLILSIALRNSMYQLDAPIPLLFI
jgi:hypothetical protein